MHTHQIIDFLKGYLNNPNVDLKENKDYLSIFEQLTPEARECLQLICDSSQLITTRIEALKKLDYVLEKNELIDASGLHLLFGDFKLLIDYLHFFALQSKNKTKTFHDACLFRVPLDPTGWSRDAWIEVANNNKKWWNLIGNDDFIKCILPSADKIESSLRSKADRETKEEADILFACTLNPAQKLPFNKAWKNFVQDKSSRKYFKEFLKTCPMNVLLNEYHNLLFVDAHLNIEAAIEFKKQGLTQLEFSKYLGLKPEDSDLIPNIVITEDNIEIRTRYYLKKLPSTDPRATCLGKITGCCQSLGGVGEPCVYYGIQRPNSGFYVICKREKRNIANSDPIVSQAWAWRNEKGDVVLDSIESSSAAANGKIEGTAFTNMDVFLALYAELAEQLVTSHGVSSVMVGIGGRTPEHFGFVSYMKSFPKDDQNNRITYSDASIGQRILASNYFSWSSFLIVFDQRSSVSKDKREKAFSILKQHCSIDDVNNFIKILYKHLVYDCGVKKENIQAFLIKNASLQWVKAFFSLILGPENNDCEYSHGLYNQGVAFLNDAILYQRLDIVQHLIPQYLKRNLWQFWSQTSKENIYNNVSVFKYLVESGMSIEWCALENALEKKQYSVAMYLFELTPSKYSSCEIFDELGIGRCNAPIINNERMIFLKLLIERDFQLNLNDDIGADLLRCAVAHHEWDFIKYLMGRGLELNIRNAYNGSALMYSAVEGNVGGVKFLADFAQLQELKDSKSVIFRNNLQESASHVEILKYLNEKIIQLEPLILSMEVEKTGTLRRVYSAHENYSLQRHAGVKAVISSIDAHSPPKKKMG